MAVDITMSVRGLAGIDKALEELPLRLQVGILADGLHAGAELLRASMSRRAPRDPRVAPPTLADDIGVVIEVSSPKGLAVAHIGPEKQVFYGGFVELGTSRMAARPFMRPAIDEDGMAAVDAMAATMGRAIEQVWAIETRRNTALVSSRR